MGTIKTINVAFQREYHEGFWRVYRAG